MRARKSGRAVDGPFHGCVEPMALHKYFCTFPQELISEPIVSHTLGEKFGVIPNIRAASITDALALVVVRT